MSKEYNGYYKTVMQEKFRIKKVSYTFQLAALQLQ